MRKTRMTIAAVALALGDSANVGFNDRISSACFRDYCW